DEVIKAWLNPPEPALNHERLRKLHKDGTCSWFFDATFEEWKKSINAVYWIYGKPGTGKSVLCSSVIDHLWSSCDEYLAYFYFDFRDVRKESVSGFLSSLIFQLASSSPKCHTVLKKSRSKQRASLEPTLGLLSGVLEEMLRARSGTILVIDALDECPELSREHELLPLLHDLVSHDSNRLRLLMTSRPEADIRRAMNRIPSHRLKLHDADQHSQDLELYISDELRRTEYDMWSDDFKASVKVKLNKMAGGMFLWVNLQLYTLRRCSPLDVEEVLNDLPKGLMDTYERSLKNLGLKGASLVRVRRLFHCLAFSRSPLSPGELAEVLAINFDLPGNALLDPQMRVTNPEECLLHIGSLPELPFGDYAIWYWEKHIFPDAVANANGPTDRMGFSLFFTGQPI
ncbi:hypothetical protein K488DRAFT_72810, partial [Vararia minispora EC-137]